jgi:nicotinamide-nucleotide amidase
MIVELITIGSELLNGNTLNTNALFIGDQLARVGVPLARQVSIPDDNETIVAAVRTSLDRADWVIVSGGLGPTHDDITKKALARVFNRQLVFHDELLERLKARYERKGRPLSPLLDTQAVQPADAEFIPNELGTAVGIILTEGSKTLVAIPGVPPEMEPMVSGHIVPRIAEAAKAGVVSKVWSTSGWTESHLYEALEPVITAFPDVAVAFLPSLQGIRLRFSAGGSDAETRLTQFADSARPLLGDALYAEDEVSLEATVGQILTEQNKTIALAESCTGGLVAKRLTDVSGASQYVHSGLVTYDNAAKIDLLGVDASLIESHGAVSEEVARAMADGALSRCGTGCALSITGIAGPTGGTADKPVGLVWMAVAMRGQETLSKEVRLLGNRHMIRERAAQAALNFLRLRLLGRIS